MPLPDEIQESQENLIDQFSEHIQSYYDWEAQAQEELLATLFEEEETNENLPS